MTAERTMRTMAFIPYPQVVETTPRGERSWDIFSRLAQGPHRLPRHRDQRRRREHHHRAAAVSRERRSRKRDHALHQQPGRRRSPPASRSTTRCSTCAARSRRCVSVWPRSMAAWLLAAGTPGMRRALPNSRIMIHQPLGGVRGQATDIEIHAQRDPVYARTHERNHGRSTPANRPRRSSRHRARQVHVRRRSEGIRHHRQRHRRPRRRPERGQRTRK